ncbi:cation diffusion facilitator family transporter [Myxococcota bacterium]|nr:cation diffusion facilitator family transporter [Myxococcota bacterium]
MTHTPQHPALQRAMRLSLAVSVTMLVGKLLAWWLTNSTALLSDAAESVIHILATSLAAFSLWYAAQPPDRKHVYGHGKIAYFSIGFEGVILAVAALGILAKAIHDLFVPAPLQRLGLGLLLAIGLIAINLALGWHLLAVGKKHQSSILRANGMHVLTDMWTSLAGVLGVGLVWFTNIRILDPIAAIVIGLHILHSAWELLAEAYQGLMERTDQETTDRILQCLDTYTTSHQIESYHQLRHRLVHRTLFVELHLLLDPGLRLAEAHRRASLLELDLQRAFPQTEVIVTTHLEPASAPCHPKGYEEPTSDPLALGDAWNPHSHTQD